MNDDGRFAAKICSVWKSERRNTDILYIRSTNKIDDVMETTYRYVTLDYVTDSWLHTTYSMYSTYERYLDTYIQSVLRIEYGTGYEHLWKNWITSNYVIPIKSNNAYHANLALQGSLPSEITVETLQEIYLAVASCVRSEVDSCHPSSYVTSLILILKEYCIKWYTELPLLPHIAKYSQVEM